MPDLYILGGPNGVGKSTRSQGLLRQSNIPIIDGDKIVRQLIQDKKPAILADNVIRGEIMDHIKNQRSFVMESNLDTPVSFGYRDLAKEKGFNTQLVYMGVDNLDILNARVKQRADLGLHFIDPANVKRKYDSALSNLPNQIHKFDKVSFYDGTLKEPVKLVTWNMNKITFESKNLPKWADKVLSRYKELEAYRDKIKKPRKGRGTGFSFLI